MGAFRRLWWGNYSLPGAFWGFYLAGCVLVVPAIAGLVSGLFIVFRARPLGVLAAVIILGGYWTVATVGVWRCADRYAGSIWWAVFTRVVVVLMTAMVGWKLVSGGPSQSPTRSCPRTSAACWPRSRIKKANITPLSAAPRRPRHPIQRANHRGAGSDTGCTDDAWVAHG